MEGSLAFTCQSKSPHPAIGGTSPRQTAGFLVKWHALSDVCTECELPESKSTSSRRLLPEASAALTLASVAVWMMVEMVSLAVQVSSKSVTSMPMRGEAAAACWASKKATSSRSAVLYSRLSLPAADTTQWGFQGAVFPGGWNFQVATFSSVHARALFTSQGLQAQALNEESMQVQVLEAAPTMGAQFRLPSSQKCCNVPQSLGPAWCLHG